MRAKIAFLVLLLALTSCSAYRLVEPTRQDIAGRYSVTTPVEWTGATVSNGEYWTINGAALDELNFFAGIKPGEPLVNAYGSEVEPPAFKASMRASEVMELVTDSLAFQGYRKVRGSKLRPSTWPSGSSAPASAASDGKISMWAATWSRSRPGCM